MAGKDEREFAAALRLAGDTGLLSQAGLVHRIDAELVGLAAPPHWLIAASLAKTPADRLQVLADASQEHPMIEDSLSFLDALAMAVERCQFGVVEVVRRASRIWYVDDLPADIKDMVHDLDVEVSIAYDRGLPEDTASVRTATERLLRHSLGRSRWHEAIRRVFGSLQDGHASNGGAV
jgi:hypothetical protein